MDSPKMLSRLVLERPFWDSGEPPNKPVAIEFPGHTSLDTKPKLVNDRPAGTNAITACSRFAQTRPATFGGD